MKARRELGNDRRATPAEQRAQRRARLRRDREAIQLVNWGLLGPRKTEDGNWTPGEHRAGSCGRRRGARVGLGVTDIFGERTGVYSGLETCSSPWA